MIKDKLPRDPNQDLDQLYDYISQSLPQAKPNRTDGLKLDFPEGWVHLRKSNTEPILRVYAEAGSQEEAQKLVGLVKGFMASTPRNN